MRYWIIVGKETVKSKTKLIILNTFYKHENIFNSKIGYKEERNEIYFCNDR